ncbi:hypothetical protein GCM10022197_12930 [Microlunatus spumicola]|uniref:Uncharacterized protein n=1 Tax=Microlunatus spumicola TaxID=81499 RepID=A0ABP6X1X1_9ACTN
MVTRPRVDEARRPTAPAPSGTDPSRSTEGRGRDDRTCPTGAEEMSRAECEARLSVLLRCT